MLIGANETLEGVTEALSLMHIGDRDIFIIPSSLGYGDKGWGTAVPPKATLVFDMELIANKEKSVGTILDSVLFGKPNKYAYDQNNDHGEWYNGDDRRHR